MSAAPVSARNRAVRLIVNNPLPTGIIIVIVATVAGGPRTADRLAVGARPHSRRCAR